MTQLQSCTGRDSNSSSRGLSFNNSAAAVVAARVLACMGCRDLPSALLAVHETLSALATVAHGVAPELTYSHCQMVLRALSGCLLSGDLTLAAEGWAGSERWRPHASDGASVSMRWLHNTLLQSIACVPLNAGPGASGLDARAASTGGAPSDRLCVFECCLLLLIQTDNRQLQQGLQPGMEMAWEGDGQQAADWTAGHDNDVHGHDASMAGVLEEAAEQLDALVCRYLQCTAANAGLSQVDIASSPAVWDWVLRHSCSMLTRWAALALACAATTSHWQKRHLMPPGSSWYTFAEHGSRTAAKNAELSTGSLFCNTGRLKCCCSRCWGSRMRQHQCLRPHHLTWLRYLKH